MKVYHGSYLKIDTIDLEKCEIGKDFGRGFYVTKIREQAEFWAERKGLSHKTTGFVTEFDFNENAHDKIATRINDYLSGKLLKQDFLDELKFFKETHQICFCRARSLQMLDYIENPKDISCEISKIGEQVLEKLMLDNHIDELQATDLFYNYIYAFVVNKLDFSVQMIKGLISDISETDEEQQKQSIASDNVSVNVSVKDNTNVSVKDKIIDMIAQMPTITVKELAKILSVTERTIYRQIDILKAENKIERVGSDKTGYWKIN